MKKRHSFLYYITALGFLIGIHQGRVALWKDEDPEPIKVFPFRAELLPKADQRALEQGIRVESEEELARLLQDFLS